MNDTQQAMTPSGTLQWYHIHGSKNAFSILHLTQEYDLWSSNHRCHHWKRAFHRGGNSRNVWQNSLCSQRWSFGLTWCHITFTRLLSPVGLHCSDTVVIRRVADGTSTILSNQGECFFDEMTWNDGFWQRHWLECPLNLSPVSSDGLLAMTLCIRFTNCDRVRHETCFFQSSHFPKVSVHHEYFDSNTM